MALFPPDIISAAKAAHADYYPRGPFVSSAMIRLTAALWLILLSCLPVWAQTPVCIVVNGSCVSAANPIPTSAMGTSVAANITQWASGTLGAMANYGTSPGAVLVPGMNAFVTNALSVSTWAAGALGAMANYGTSPGAVLVPGVNAYVTNTVSSNTAQVNGITTLTGAGAVGTGSQRVAVGQDTTTIAGAAPGTAGTASANVVTVQGVASMTPVQTTVGAGTAAIGKVGVGYTSAQTPITASATGTTAATTATLAGTSGKTTYICGYSVDADATTATVVNMTVTGLISGTATRREGVGPVSAGTVSTWQNYSPCLPASGQNVGIAVVSGAAGTAGNTAVNAWGYQE